MKNKILFTSLLMILQKDIKAQSFKLGIEAGFGIANTLTDPGVSYFSTAQTANNNRIAMRSGIALHSNLGKKSAFQTGLNYAAKGNKNIVPGGLTISYNSIELPLSFVYMAKKHAKRNFWIGGGCYVAYTINAKVNYISLQSKEVSEKAKYGDIMYVDDLQRFDYGAQIQSGLSFKNGLYIRIIAQRQLNNLAPKKMPDLNIQYHQALGQVQILKHYALSYILP